VLYAATVTAVFRTYFAFAQLNVEAECISLPVDFAVVIDRSGSMDAVGPDGRTRMESALIATQAFIANVNYSKDQVALISFSGTLDDIQQPTVRECNNTIHTTLTDVQSDVESALASVGIVKPCDVRAPRLERPAQLRRAGAVTRGVRVGGVMEADDLPLGRALRQPRL